MATPDESDHDLRLSFFGGYLSPGGRFSASFSGGAWWDMDGLGGSGDLATFGSVRDESDLTWDVYSLWAQYDAEGTGLGRALRYARFGRQTSALGVPITFDGVHALFQAGSPKLDLFVFGGRTAHFFELDDDLFEDWLASTGAVWRVLPELQLTLDYRFQMEENQETAASPITDHGYGLEMRYRPSPSTGVSAYCRGLDDALSHLGLAAHFRLEKARFGGDLALDGQTVTLREVTQALDPYYSILGASLPNLRWTADFWQEMPSAAGLFALHAGWQGKAIIEGEDQAFNRNFGKFYLLGAVQEIAGTGAYAHLVVDLHFAGFSPHQTADEGSMTLGGSAGWKGHGVQTEAGTYYSRYKYRYYADVSEAADVRTVFVDASWGIVKWLSARVRYEFERFDWDVHTVTLSLTQRY